MTIIAADDEPLMLNRLVRAIKECCPQADVASFSKPSELIAWAEENSFDCAFLDIRMRGVSGIDIAAKLKESRPESNIVSVTGYGEYAGEAMSMHASGYILKPVTREKVERELSDLRYPKAAQKIIRVKCFGNFDVYAMDGEKVVFSRSKSKELFAYLVYKSGSFCTVGEIAAAIFDDEDGDEAKRRAYLRVLLHDLMNSLKQAGAEGVISKTYGGISCNPGLIDCDWYRFNEGDAEAIKTYAGEFMNQFSWAEAVNGYLEGVLRDRKGF
ncbi:MAG: LytR/AlgR family response regulator transcription factor [Candidatus Coproplasma sp.]